MDPGKLKEVRDNATEVKDYLAGLSRWENDIKKEDTRLLDLKSQNKSLVGEKDELPIRSPIPNLSDTEPEMNHINNGKTSSANCVPSNGEKRITAYDYSAWEKYDVDEALHDVDKPPNKRPSADAAKQQSKKQLKQSRSRKSEKKPIPAQPTLASGPTKEEQITAAKLKDDGNTLYSSGQYEAAVRQYTAGLAMDQQNHILFANRAMAYIKMDRCAEAESDCNACLLLSPSYLKAYLRRGAVRTITGDLPGALRDYNKVLEHEPWNKDAKQRVSEINNKMNELKKNNTRDKTKCKPNKTCNKTVSSSTSDDSSNPVREGKLIKNAVNGTTKRRVEEESREPAADRISGLQDAGRAADSGDRRELISNKDGDDASSVKENLDPDIILPVDKPVHLRSQKPLQKIAVVDVKSEAEIPGLRRLQASTSIEGKRQEQLDNREQEPPLANRNNDQLHTSSHIQLGASQDQPNGSCKPHSPQSSGYNKDNGTTGSNQNQSSLDQQSLTSLASLTITSPLAVSSTPQQQQPAATVTPAAPATITPAAPATITPAAPATITSAAPATITPVAAAATITPVATTTSIPAAPATITPAAAATITPVATTTSIPAAPVTITPASAAVTITPAVAAAITITPVEATPVATITPAAAAVTITPAAAAVTITPVAPAAVTITPAAAVTITPAIPRTSHQFMSSWTKLASSPCHQTLAVSWLQSIKPWSISNFELEVDCINSLVTTFTDWLGSEASSPESVSMTVQSYLEAIAASKGFPINVLFMTEPEKTNLLQLLHRLQELHKSLSPKLTSLKPSLV